MKKMYIVLEDGHIFEGKGYGATGETVGELVFTTGVVGYIETLTDAAYYGQIVLQTFPLIGNYGIINEDTNGVKPVIKGYIAREISDMPSNFRCDGKLEDYLKENGIITVCDVDTRELTKLIRENGAMNACITEDPAKVDLDALKAYKVKNALASVASGKKGYFEAEDMKYSVAIIDCGATANAIEKLTEKGCSVTVLPYNTPAEEILAMNVDGVVVSNGPGNPEENTELITEVGKLMDEKPVFGFGLGHQLMALAKGGKTAKMKFGHRGGSVPVRNTADGKVFATHQNHGYVVSEIPTEAKAIFTNVSDNTNEGLEYANAFSIQFTPDCFSATVDTDKIYDKFISLMGGDK
ncbi:MAG: carbamoyl phosphate synthase small subunit [Clostridia bacterium]|nr:carbamoyl phosphate synthase small subunit [Clostridia bacterium]